MQQATGKLLPLYGSELFNAPEVTFVPDASSPAPADYVLGPGDEVRLQVWGGVDYDGSLTIDRNGQVTIPRAGTVNLAGVRVRDVESALRSQLGRTFANFELNANLGRLRTIQVYVVGQAQRPGTYTLSSLSTLVNALFASGGPNANGSMRRIELKRGGRHVTTLDLYNFIGSGDKSGDTALQPGDVIVIPPVGPQVAITGALDQAAIYELKDKATTLNDVLALSGGVPTLATPRKALLERVDPSQTPARQVQDIALDGQGLRQPLRDGDIVTLLPISPAFANAVTLQGNVAAPLRYRWFPGMKLRDLIPEREALITSDYFQRKNLLVQSVETNDAGSTRGAGGALTNRVRTMVDQINWDYAVIERLDRDQLRTQIVPFNLGRLLQGDETQNLPLQQGDVVTVLSQKDLQLPALRQTRLVRLEGEVAAAGLYEIQPGETLRQLIERVGGLTPQAYVFGTALDREAVRKKQQENLEQLIRRLESQQQSQILYQVANHPTTDSASQAIILQQQQALGRSQIEALRKMRSDGRIALELDPRQQTVAALPDLPLEDGDHIVVPSTPGFVSAVGAVNNENVFIYRPSRTVAEVAQSAGLREEADRDQMFVLRADGSIITRRDSRGGFFGGGFDSLALMPGDTLVVPEKLDRETTRNFVARQLKDWTQILSQFGLGVAAIKVIKDL
ncbi:SLBB domain-containing protein [Xylophilus sp.]|uniref:SLBB domain-containing protein n=1 Tax=Xylophilus sp. TaxID=2653893 RepID=UPI002D7E9C36|nr:SLBB domain-containing protein [Xylophilus sp.]